MLMLEIFKLFCDTEREINKADSALVTYLGIRAKANSGQYKSVRKTY